MSPAIPARCMRCGHQWQPAGGIEITGDATNVRMSGNTLHQACPECGGSARFLEGNFDVRDGAFQLHSGPQWSADLIEHLRLGLAQIMQEQPRDPERALQAVDAEFAALVEDAVRRGLAAQGKPASQRRRFSKTRALLQAVVMLLAVNYADVGDNAAWVGDQLQALLQHLAETGEVAGIE